ncbi:alpha/beta fold hydrolase [Patescibacteria group bacterium]|nr:alpha/beta fold hydrolase [Patescibacteria group bacterium]
MRNKVLLLFIIIILVSAGVIYFYFNNQNNSSNLEANSNAAVAITNQFSAKANSAPVIEEPELPPMAIQSLRNREYTGGDFVIEEQLPNGTNYQQYIASYQSEGLKIFGLLTVPFTDKPASGWPAILFIHGYIQPEQYSTTGNYPTYQARLARSGFVTFKPDLRGHGNSEGESESAHHSEKYLVDTLYALSYLKKYDAADPDRIGYWGHSNGGEIGLRVAVISPDIKAFSFWAGVVGSYEDMFETYNDKIGFLRNITDTELVQENKLPSANPDFWNQLDPYAFLDDISAPIQLQHGTADESVPVELSLRLKEELEKLDKPVEYYEYAEDDHNIASNVSTAFQRAIDFYNKYL